MTTQVTLGFRNGLARKVHQAKAFDADGSIGRNLLTNGGSVVAPDVDDDLIACTEHVVLGSGKVHRWFEGEFLRIKDVASEDGEFLLLNRQHHFVFAPESFGQLIAGLALEFFGRGESVTGVAAGVYKSAVVSCSTSNAGGGRGPAGCSATAHAVLSTCAARRRSARRRCACSTPSGGDAAPRVGITFEVEVTSHIGALVGVTYSATRCLLGGGCFVGAQSTCFAAFLVEPLYAIGLFLGHTTTGEFQSNGALVLACLQGGYDIVENLLVGHRRALCQDIKTAKHQKTTEEKCV